MYLEKGYIIQIFWLFELVFEEIIGCGFKNQSGFLFRKL